jgi:hypothetical protein
MGRVMINIKHCFDLTNAVCDKLYEWFGDVGYITGVVDENLVMHIYFDGHDVGLFSELCNGIVKLFFDETTDCVRINKLKYKLNMRFLYNRKTEIIDIARLIIKYKVLLIKDYSYE